MSEEEQKREFTGIWIPKAVLEDDRLTWTERAIFAEISCYPECFMSNGFMAQRIGVSTRWIQQAIAKLKALGYIHQVRYDGRRRILQAYTHTPVKPEEEPNATSHQTRSTLHPSHELHFTSDRNSTSPIDNKREQSLEHSEAYYRERSQPNSFPRINTLEDIDIRSPWQAKAKYVAAKLGTPPNRISSILKACRDYPESSIDHALTVAVDATVRDKTGLFFKTLLAERMVHKL